MVQIWIVASLAQIHGNSETNANLQQPPFLRKSQHRKVCRYKVLPSIASKEQDLRRGEDFKFNGRQGS